MDWPKIDECLQQIFHGDGRRQSNSVLGKERFRLSSVIRYYSQDAKFWRRLLSTHHNLPLLRQHVQVNHEQDPRTYNITNSSILLPTRFTQLCWVFGGRIAFILVVCFLCDFPQPKLIEQFFYLTLLTVFSTPLSKLTTITNTTTILFHSSQ